MYDDKQFLSKLSYKEISFLYETLKKFPENNTYAEKCEILKDYCEQAMKECLENSLYSNDLKFYKEGDEIFNFEFLNYDELLTVYYIFNTVYKNTNEEIYKKLYLACDKVLYSKEQEIRTGAVSITDMSLEQFRILLNTSSSNSLEWYALDCNVKEEELTPRVLYKKYHRDNKVRWKK